MDRCQQILDLSSVAGVSKSRYFSVYTTVNKRQTEVVFFYSRVNKRETCSVFIRVNKRWIQILLLPQSSKGRHRYCLHKSKKRQTSVLFAQKGYIDSIFTRVNNNQTYVQFSHESAKRQPQFFFLNCQQKVDIGHVCKSVKIDIFCVYTSVNKSQTWILFAQVSTKFSHRFCLYHSQKRQKFSVYTCGNKSQILVSIQLESRKRRQRFCFQKCQQKVEIGPVFTGVNNRIYMISLHISNKL